MRKTHDNGINYQISRAEGGRGGVGRTALTDSRRPTSAGLSRIPRSLPRTVAQGEEVVNLGRGDFQEFYKTVNQEGLATSGSQAQQERGETIDSRFEAMRNNLEQAEAEVMTELGLSRVGLSGSVEDQTRARFSTFPKWVPPELRSKRLFNRVAELIENNEEPRGSRQEALMNIISEEIASRMEPELLDEMALSNYFAEIAAMVVRPAIFLDM